MRAFDVKVNQCTKFQNCFSVISFSARTPLKLYRFVYENLNNNSLQYADFTILIELPYGGLIPKNFHFFIFLFFLFIFFFFILIIICYFEPKKVVWIKN